MNNTTVTATKNRLRKALSPLPSYDLTQSLSAGAKSTTVTIDKFAMQEVADISSTPR